MNRHRIALGLLVLASLAPVAAAGTPDAGARLRQLLERDWEHTLRDDPSLASSLGDRRYNDLWKDSSLEAWQRRQAHRLELLSELDRIDPAGLDPGDRLNYTLFRKKIETAVEGHKYRWYLLPVNQRGGIQTLSDLADSMSFETAKDFEDWIARMNALPELMDQTIALMKEGIRARMVHPKVIMERIPAQISAQIVEDPADSLFYKPFRSLPDTLPAAERERLSGLARRAITDKVVPSYRRFLEFFTGEYLPACLDRVGIWQLPEGKQLYMFRARSYTTTDLTPLEIHEIGLKEVERIRGEMHQIIEQVHFGGTFDEFLEFLRTARDFYYEDPEELLDSYRALSKRIDPTLVRLFRTLPRTPYGIEPIPAHIAPDTTTAYYRRPAADGSRAGTYFVNLYRPEVRPKYEMEALSLHEAVPGHHFQIALAMELGDLPAFRRYEGYTAFVEGWGLYAESLGEELGFYRDPYSKFGQLTYEMWRAVRLVVDTGMHFLGWSRPQAIEFFKANAAKTEHDIVNEIDRYIAWPGQALAYKIGELRIKQLRARCERDLGARFDVREFHDVVLRNGAVPLDVLDSIVDDWIADTLERDKVGIAE